jgi:DNA-directed RNA polymerase specialized sigma subunit
MGKRIDKKTGETKYFIPVYGKYYETNQEVYEAYYKMERRERYLEERSLKYEKSYEGLQAEGFQIESNSSNDEKLTEDVAITTVMIEKMLDKLIVLNDYEMWLIHEIYTHGKSERQIEKEADIPRRTVGYHKKKVLEKLRKELD